MGRIAARCVHALCLQLWRGAWAQLCTGEGNVRPSFSLQRTWWEQPLDVELEQFFSFPGKPNPAVTVLCATKFPRARAGAGSSPVKPAFPALASWLVCQPWEGKWNIVQTKHAARSGAIAPCRWRSLWFTALEAAASPVQPASAPDLRDKNAPSSGDTAGHRGAQRDGAARRQSPVWPWGASFWKQPSSSNCQSSFFFFSLFWRHNALFSLLFALAALHVTQGSREEYDFSSFRISFVWASFLPNPQLITLRWRLPRMKEHLCACCILALTYHRLATQLC